MQPCRASHAVWYTQNAVLNAGIDRFYDMSFISSRHPLMTHESLPSSHTLGFSTFRFGSVHGFSQTTCYTR
jgi:hypothetical protein